MNETPPPLTEHYKANFQTLLKAVEFGEVALVSSVRISDNAPVALICAMQRNEDDTITPIPFAVMVEGNPFELFQDPTTMTSNVRQTAEITLTMTAAEALWLKYTLQNGPPDEPADQAEKRAQMFDALPRMDELVNAAR